jgi:DNA-binding transcriptional LysR family regulator
MDQSGEMSVYVNVVREGGFSAAAKVLGLTPSAVSKQISRLEARLDVRLLNRTTRQLSMTDEGETYFHRATAILSEIEEVEAMVSNRFDTPRGTLRVSSSIAFGRHQIVPLMPEFLNTNPEVKLQLSLSDNLVDLVQEGFDVAIRVAELMDSSLVARRLAVDRRVVCAAPSYIEKHGCPQSPEALRDHNCLVVSQVPSMRDWEFSFGNTVRKIHVEGRFETNSGVAVHEAVLDGIGIAQLPAFLVAPDIRAGRLVSFLDDRVATGKPIYAVYPHRRHLSPKVRVFIDFLVDKLTPVPPWEV